MKNTIQLNVRIDGKLRNGHRLVAAVSQESAGGQLPISNATKKRLQRKLRAIMGWKVWPKDILRHTCASHWLAVVPDAQRIALQLGNSPAILLRHYRSIVTKEDAEKFWT